MLATVAKAFSVPEIRRKLLFVAGILALYRLEKSDHERNLAALGR